ncbi:MAG: glycosyltransferase family 2 protein [Intestinibacter sp.]|uniref:glycosyltransferase family 2 protein n=1 Tax=Intestinibacter sp. TaxID=1965304 RepID=UPI003F14AC56
MNIVITMAGLGSRFKKAGYKVEKYMIEAKGHTLFYWSMISLEDFFDDNFIFIIKKEDNASDFIKNSCNELNIQKYKIVEIDGLTDGQATTALAARPYCEQNQPIIIYNIDTYVEKGGFKKSDFRGDGFIPCFYGKGDHWSFAKINQDGKVVEVREKNRISPNCTLGLYYFKTIELYEKLYEKCYVEDNNLEVGERYVAPIYNYLIKNGGDVYISIIEQSKIHVLGTPEELEKFKNICIKQS